MDKLDRGKRVIKNWKKRSTKKSVWMEHWDEVTRFLIPRKENVYGQAVAGEKRGNELFDGEGIRCNDDMTSAFHTLMIPANAMWFSLGLSRNKQALNLDEASRLWFHQSSQICMEVINGSNFQVEVAEAFQDLGSLGTTVLNMEEDEEEIVRFYSRPIYNATLKENARGDVRTVQICEEYDEDEMFERYAPAIEKDDDLKRLISNCNGKKFKVIHEIGERMPHEIKEGEAFGSEKFPYYSVHVLERTGHILREGGFEEWPCATPRITKNNDEVYGRSPGMKALSEIKMKNQMMKVTIQSAQIAMAPPIQAPHNAFLAPLDLTPFGVSYRRGSEKAEPLFTGANINFSIEMLEYIKKAIQESFYTDKLKTIVGDRATATEVIQKRDEQYRFLSPVLSRLDRELLKPVIDRVFGICRRKKLLPEMPESLKAILNANGGKVKIEYLSPIAQAQKATSSENISRALAASAPIMQIQPEVADNIDGDKQLRKNWSIFNADPEILRKEADVQKMRKARQEAAQREAELVEGGAEADQIKAMSEAEKNANQRSTG